MKKIILSVTAAAFLFSGCAQMNSVMSNNGVQNVNNAIKTAQMKYDEAHKQNVAWKNTKSLLKKAKEMAKMSKNKEAIALANEAAYEAQTAMTESKEYDKTWRSTVPQ